VLQAKEEKESKDQYFLAAEYGISDRTGDYTVERPLQSASGAGNVV
jgi:hypothetical protein